MNEKFEGVVLSDTTIHYKDEGGAVAGANAIVGTAGDIDRRITATRLILTGPFAFGLRKKKDKRELYLTVEGSDFAPLDPLSNRTGRAITPPPRPPR